MAVPLQEVACHPQPKECSTFRRRYGLRMRERCIQLLIVDGEHHRRLGAAKVPPPKYRKISGVGGVEDITGRAFEALAD